MDVFEELPMSELGVTYAHIPIRANTLSTFLKHCLGWIMYWLKTFGICFFDAEFKDLELWTVQIWPARRQFPVWILDIFGTHRKEFKDFINDLFRDPDICKVPFDGRKDIRVLKAHCGNFEVRDVQNVADIQVMFMRFLDDSSPNTFPHLKGLEWAVTDRFPRYSKQFKAIKKLGSDLMKAQKPQKPGGWRDANGYLTPIACFYCAADVIGVWLLAFKLWPDHWTENLLRRSQVRIVSYVDNPPADNAARDDLFPDEADRVHQPIGGVHLPKFSTEVCYHGLPLEKILLKCNRCNECGALGTAYSCGSGCNRHLCASCAGVDMGAHIHHPEEVPAETDSGEVLYQ